jgi:sigma-E factor negative regulatory protein RseC
VNESDAVVTRLEGDYAWVDLRSGCTTCGALSSCGLSDGKGKPQQRLRNGVGAQVGDQVVISVPHGVVLRAAFYCYLLPLVMVFALAVSGMAVANETGAIFGTLAGLGLGWFVVRSAGKWEPLPSMQLKHAVVYLHRN